MTKIFTSDLHDKIIKLTAQYGYITIDEVSLLIGDRRKAFNVMAYLYQKGVIRTIPTMLRPSKAYYLPENWRKTIESSGEVQYIKTFQPYTYRPTNFYHHTNLIKVHIIIQQVFTNRLKEFITEAQLRQEKTKGEKVCDGEFIFTNTRGETKKIGIEVQLTLPSYEVRRERLKALVDYANKNLNGVIILYNIQTIKDRMKETLMKYTNPTGHIFFAGLDDFLKMRGQTEFEELKGNKVKLISS